MDAYTYDGRETDSRLTVELWEPSPYLPSANHTFDGLHFDERGLVVKFCDGNLQAPKTYEMQIVFSGGFECVRMSSVSALEEDALAFFQKAAGVERPKFWAFRCKYTNFFNWCVRKRFDDERLASSGYHYVLGALDTLVEVFSAQPPRVFFNGYGIGIPNDACEPYPCCDILYDL